MSYVHKEDTHNLTAPRQIVPVIYSMVQPKSVIDIGCGIGTFLNVFKELGVSEVKGIDGEWVNMKLLQKYLSDDEFSKGNLSEYIDVKRKYDLALCLEVGEHIEEENSDKLIKTLVNASDLILFSAAVPYQSGQFHINEQWPSYWKEKFLRHDYKFLDVVRLKFWDKNISEFWYKQNLFFAVNSKNLSTYNFLSAVQSHIGIDVIHPDLYLKNSSQLYTIETGKREISYYLKLLIKTLLFKSRIIKK